MDYEITFAKFREECEGAPLDDERLLSDAAKIHDHELGGYARAALNALYEFYAVLDRVKFQRG